MQAEITFLTQRGTAAIRRSGRVTTERLRFGRGTNNEVPLPDIRVPLSAAVLYQGQDGLFIEKSGDLPLRINGQPTQGALVRIGDEIGIGPYRILLHEPPAGLDVAFSVELARPIGDSLQRIVEHSSIGLEATHLSKRRPSWVLFLVLIAAALVAPILAYEESGRVTAPTAVSAAGGTGGAFRAAWNPGQLSNAHRYFANQCATCHRVPFTAVRDSACLGCHKGIGAHVPATQAAGTAALHADLQNRRCADCHIEHRGLDSLVLREGALCVKCHRSLAQKAPAAGILDGTAFPDGHPQFRATVVADPSGPTLAKVTLDRMPKPADHPDLVFSHKAHLRRRGFPALGIKPMVCSQCHVAEPSGQGFLPITFKGQCQSCHKLRFDIDLPWKQGPHGDDRAVAGAVEGFYAAQVVEHGVPAAAVRQEIERRLPGNASTSTPMPAAPRAWVAQKTEAALAVIFKSKEGCFYCHLADPRRGRFRVAPVRMLIRFLPMARFDHASHRALDCEDCHAARQSQSSANLLIPGIKRCTTCHGAESAAFKAETTCVSCHVFHRHELGPMRETAGVSKMTRAPEKAKR
ncbi:MAG TPA: cytochrome c3 family protein [Stellaceae bacterium]|nr:cytochrome c3 family protein [Stellaceae bacterium]